jgi:hypothetical protein
MVFSEFLCYNFVGIALGMHGVWGLLIRGIESHFTLVFIAHGWFPSSCRWIADGSRTALRELRFFVH